LKLLSVIEHPTNHEIYFDDFFTSYYLMCLLSERHFFATGTIRANRLNGAVLKTGKELKKGETDYTFDKTNQILFTRWSDNKEVTLATNHQKIEPMASTFRYDKNLKKKVNKDVAQVIHQYNLYMGGVDLHDNAVSNYRIAIRGKKWWWPLFVTRVDSAMVNAWKLHCIVSKQQGKKTMPQIDFRVQVTEELLLTPDIDDDEEFQGFVKVAIPKIKGKHLVTKDPAQKYQRCGVCHKPTIFMCSKCNKHLHTKCFDQYPAHL
jgi:hypothetical protein